MHKKRFGDVPGLSVELEASVEELLANLRLTDEASARVMIRKLAEIENLAGETLATVGRRARALHLLADHEAAKAAYGRWLLRAARDHPQRKQFALGLYKAERGERSGVLVGEVFRDCDVCPEMVVLPSGRFMMGSPGSEAGRYKDEGPQHLVSVRSFALGKYEVTFSQ